MAVQPEVIKPPRTEVGLLGWLTKNLFSTWYNVLLTIFSIAFIYVVLRAVITWVVRDARWRVVTVNLRVFMIGRYPVKEAWRVWVSLGILVSTFARTELPPPGTQADAAWLPHSDPVRRRSCRGRRKRKRQPGR